MPNAAATDLSARGGKAGGGKGGSSGSVGKGGGGRPRPGDWACHLCGFQSNRDFRARCWNCEAVRNAGMEQALGSFAHKQLQQQRRAQQQQQQRQQGKGGGNPSASASAECRELREQMEKLRAELAATKALAARGGGPAAEDDDVDMDDGDDGGYAAWTEDERAKRLELARGGLAYATACYGEDSTQAEELRGTIAALQKASREAKPFKAHRNLLERRRDELRRKQERDEAAITKAQSDIAELQEKVETLKTAVEERAKAIAAVAEELNGLVLKSLAEEGGGGDDKKPPWAQAAAPWDALSAALQGLAAQGGVPADVAALLSQVQQVANACAKEAKEAKATPPQGAVQQPTAEGGSAPAGGMSDGGQPTTLAPQWRRGKAATKTPITQQRPSSHGPAAAAAAASSSASLAAAAAGGSGHQVSGQTGGDATNKGEDTAATAATDGAAAAAAAGAAAAAASTGAARTTDEGSEEELVDEESSGGAMEVDIEVSLAKLPAHHQQRLRAALRKCAGEDQGDRGSRAGEGSDSRRQERERSPRPTKTNDKEL